MIRSFMGFGADAVSGITGTGFRANSNRSWTIPAHDWANLPDHVETWVQRLAGVVIEQRDAVEVIQQHDSQETLFYIDPPYPHQTRGKGSHNRIHRYRHEMSDDDHRELAAALHGVEGMVVLSGYSCELYDELYPDWERAERKSYADGAHSRTEVLWSNEAAWNARSPGPLFHQVEKSNAS